MRKEATRTARKVASVILSLGMVFQIGAVEIARATDDGEVTRKLYRNSYTGEIVTSQKAIRDSEAVEDLRGEQKYIRLATIC